MPEITPRLKIPKPAGNEYLTRVNYNSVLDAIEENAATKEDVENIEVPVSSVNAKKGAVVLTAADVGAETPSGAQGKVDTHANRKDNPHTVTKVQVGLGNVDNVKQATKEEFANHITENASLTQKGHVQLSNDVDSESETLAATPKAVKAAYDRADEAFTLGNSRKQQMVDGLLLINPGLPLTHNSTWEEINDVLLSGNVNVGKIVTGTITSESITTNFLNSNGVNSSSSAYVNFDTNMLDFVPDFILFTRTDKSSNDIDAWFSENYYAPSTTGYGNSKRGTTVFRVPYIQGVLKIPVPAPNTQFNFRAVKER